MGGAAPPGGDQVALRTQVITWSPGVNPSPGQCVRVPGMAVEGKARQALGEGS